MKRACLSWVAVTCCFGTGAHAGCRVEIHTTGGPPAVYELELARTAAARARGLMGRTELPDRGGMLFDFGTEERAVFWMRDTPIALDILFVSAGLRVVEVIANARPNSDRLLPSKAPVRYAVELAAGEAARAGVEPGATLTLPAAYPASCP